jgi:hypothetical protein
MIADPFSASTIVDSFSFIDTVGSFNESGTLVASGGSLYTIRVRTTGGDLITNIDGKIAVCCDR